MRRRGSRVTGKLSALMVSEPLHDHFSIMGSSSGLHKWLLMYYECTTRFAVNDTRLFGSTVVDNKEARSLEPEESL